MRNKFVAVLEQKRYEMREEVEEFAKRIFPNLGNKRARTLYFRICDGKQLVPEHYIRDDLLKLLNLDYGKARELNSNKIDYRNLCFTPKELRKMAKIAKDNGNELPLHALFSILEGLK